MTDLAMVHRRETFDRIRDPLKERGIHTHHVPVDGRVESLTAGSGPDLDVGLFFPTRLMEGGVVTARLAIPWVNDQSAILTSRNKAGVLATLERAGLPVPQSTYVSHPVDSSELRKTFEQYDTPVVIKPNSATRGGGIVRVNDLDSFLGVCDYLHLLHENPTTADRSFLVQEFLPSQADYRVMVIDGTYAGAVRREVPDPDRWKQNVHRGAEADGVNPDDRVKELAEAVASAVDIPLLGVDLLATEDGYVILETNARPTIDDPEKYDPEFMNRLAALIERTAEMDRDATRE